MDNVHVYGYTWIKKQSSIQKRKFYYEALVLGTDFTLLVGVGSNEYIIETYNESKDKFNKWYWWLFHLFLIRYLHSI